jgi:hypothetical protein
MYLYDVASTFVFFVALVFAICVFHMYLRNFTITPYSPCASSINKLCICIFCCIDFYCMYLVLHCVFDLTSDVVSMPPTISFVIQVLDIVVIAKDEEAKHH